MHPQIVRAQGGFRARAQRRSRQGAARALPGAGCARGGGPPSSRRSLRVLALAMRVQRQLQAPNALLPSGTLRFRSPHTWQCLSFQRSDVGLLALNVRRHPMCHHRAYSPQQLQPPSLLTQHGGMQHGAVEGTGKW